MRTTITATIMVWAVAACLAQAEESIQQQQVLDDAVVTATRPAAGPVNAATLKPAEIAAKRPAVSDTTQLLGDVPGVSIYSAGGVSGLPVIHGLPDDRIRIKVDGMDLVSACANHMNSPLSYISPANVGSLTVFPGISPVSLGGDSIGGAIIVTSREPRFAGNGEHLLTTGELGAFYRSNGDAFGANLSATVASENTSIGYNGSVAQSGNYKAASDFKPGVLATGTVDGDHWIAGDEVGSSSYRAENHQLGVALRHDNHLLGLNFGYQHIPYQGFPNQRMDMTLNESFQGNLKYTGNFLWGTLEARFYDEHTRHSMNFADDKQYYYGSAATFIAPGMPMETEGNNLGTVLKADIMLSERDLLRVGTEYQRYRLNDWWPPSPSVLPAGYTTGGMAPNTFKNINDGQRDRLALFAEWEAQWNPEWLTLFGVRGEWVEMNTGPVQGYNDGSAYNGAPLYPVTTFNALDHHRSDYNGDLTALVRYTPNALWSFETGYAIKSRSPNLYERYAWSSNRMAMEMVNFAGDGNYYIGNLDLKPEVAHTISATADWHDAARERWGLKITPYYTYVQDYIDARRCPTGVCGTSAAVQSSLTATSGFVYLQFVNQSAQLYGVDVSGAVPVVSTDDYGKVTATGVFSYVRGTNETTGDNLYNIMPPNAKLALIHKIWGWTTTAEGEFVADKTEVSQVRDELKTGGYSLFNLRSSYEWKYARLDVGITNLFDRFYNLPLGGVYTGQGATMSGTAIPANIPVPGMGRSFYAGLTAKF
ncbi:TonB-dependent receptor [Geobacter sp. AOG2]|uniref:TonB-dependent receptor n=1 Tax=Geobacter sp. AOG2 TaxID=1566347 RepID=UPI001CC5F012|nr:TonB-dependent receptor [Geobacter sp. AOG2]GFE61895.1 TonB-dependent receptor [Geobacter sp. AOG2]